MLLVDLEFFAAHGLFTFEADPRIQTAYGANAAACADPGADSA